MRRRLGLEMDRGTRGILGWTTRMMMMILTMIGLAVVSLAMTTADIVVVVMDMDIAPGGGVGRIGI
jgi:hypothetical protein